MAKKKQRVLVVDDEPLNIQMVGEILSPQATIMTATNGKQGLDLARSENKPDVILLDIMMPELDGFEVCRILKNEEDTKDIPIIFMTGNDSQDDEAKGLELGASDYVTKPFHPPVLRARVKNQLILKKKTDLLETLVSIDGLTEIYNRRYFENHFEEEFNRAKRASQPLSVLMIDIDYFKPYNDNYGHARGDDCLREVAQALKHTVKRAGDFVARYGGEEFVVVLPNSDKSVASAVANKILGVIDYLDLPHEYSQVSDRITLSIGQATLKDFNLPYSKSLLAKADEQLYQSKENGRNQITAIVIE